MDHKKVADNILNAVGGKGNVVSLTHCITRLRFRLKDFSVPKKAEVESLEGVISVVEQGGQYQVVIGNQVEPVYKEVEKLLDSQVKSTEETTEFNEEKVGLFGRFTSMISGIFTPLLGILVTAGLIKGLIAILTVSGVLTTTMNTYIVLNALGDAFMYFFPIFIGSSTAKYFKMNSNIGMLIGAIMVYPTIIAAAGSGDPFSFLGIPMNLMNYSSTVFPVIVAVWLASLIEKRLQKIIPQGLKYFLVPFIVVLLILPITFFVVGPVITQASNIVADLSFAIYNFNPVLAGLIIGGPWILIVMFGLHWAFIPIFINNMATVGFDSLMGLLAANQFAMAAAAIAIGLRVKSKTEKSLGFSTGGTALLGVSEPALYGILLPRKTPLIMAIIGGSVGGAFGGLMGTKMYTFAPSGVFGFTGAINPSGIELGFYGAIVQTLVGFVLAFVLTYFWGYKTKSKDNANATKATA